MNDINIGETFYILARERGLDQAEYFINAILPNLPIAKIGNTLTEVIEAAKIKAQYPISLLTVLQWQQPSEKRHP